MKTKQTIIIKFDEREFPFTVVLDDEFGFLWTVYDYDEAYLYGENYDPDQVNPLDEAEQYCNEYVQMNY
jgi:hypothetical protein